MIYPFYADLLRNKVSKYAIVLSRQLTWLTTLQEVAFLTIQYSLVELKGNNNSYVKGEVIL